MNPRPFIYEFDVRQVVADVREPAGVHRDVNGAAFRVVAVLGAAYGLVEGLTSERAVDFNRYAKMFKRTRLSTSAALMRFSIFFFSAVSL